jgi:RimJ/RimL family protein N-acetyltransferase
MDRPINKKKPFTFPAIKAVEEFRFEKLTSNNFECLYKMFENDENNFTDDRFKHYESARSYAIDLVKYRAFSPKNCGQDWLFLFRNDYAGILHLYDLSLETFSENNKRCWVGFAIKPELRNKGLTKKVMQIFIRYIFEYYSFIKYVHVMTDKSNKASQALLNALNFERDFTERASKERSFYICERPKAED